MENGLTKKATRGNKEELILVGVVKAAYGVRGSVIIKSFTDSPLNIKHLPVFIEDGNPVTLEIQKEYKGPSSGEVVGIINGSISRNEAEQWVKTSLYCYRHDLPELKSQDEFYIVDLVGLELVDQSGTKIGKIINVLNYGAGDIIEVEFFATEARELFPFSQEIFVTIDGGCVVFIPPY